jgi:hypothetical protein
MKIDLSPEDKKMLFVSGVIAVAVAFFFYLLQRQTLANASINGGQITDQQLDAAAPIAEGTGGLSSPVYTNYNFGPTTPIPLAPVSDTDVTSIPQDTCGCAGNGNCFGNGNNSDVNSGANTYTGNLNAYLNYLQNTNPNYVALYATQLQLYSGLFATGESYTTTAGGTLAPAGITSTTL